MDDLLLLFAFFIWLVYLSYKVGGHTTAIKEAQHKLAKFKVVKKSSTPQEQQSTDVKKTTPQEQTNSPVSTSTHIPPIVDSSAQPPTVKKSEPFETVLIKKILPTVGVLSVLLGVGFLVTWSYTNQWIGPGTLIMMGVIFSGVLVGLGEYLRSSYPKYYAYLSAAGMLGLAVCVYSSHQVYGFIGDSLAFVSYIAIVLSTFAFALRYDNRLLAFLAAAGSFLVPFLVETSNPNSMVLIGYSLVMFIGGALIMRYKGWIETGVITFFSLVIYAWMLLDATSTTLESAYAISPAVYLAWIYGALGLFSYAVVTRAFVDKGTDQEERHSIALVSVLLVTTVLINVFGHEVFKTLGWSHFGFWVLVQGAGMYGTSLFLGAQGLVRYQQLFTLGAMTSLVFATFYEVDYTVYPLAQTLLFAAQSAIFMTGARRIGGALQGIFTAGALVTQLCAFIAIGNLGGDFATVTIGMGALVALSLYNARMVFESQDNTMSVLVYIQLVLAGIVFLVWNFGSLTEELSEGMKHILPHMIVLGAVVGLMMLWVSRTHQYLVTTACLLALINAVVFVVSVGRGEGAVLFGFIASALTLYAPFGFAEYVKKQYGAVEETVFNSTLGFAAVSIGALLSWFGFWWFEEPLSTVFMALVGISMVVIGLVREHNTTRSVGLCIMGLVLAKLYLFDIWSWSTFWKFAALIPVGIALISLPFWYQKLGNITGFSSSDNVDN